MDDNVKQSLVSLEEEVAKLEKILGPVIQTPLKDLKKSLTPFENAKLNLIMAYSINTLYYMFLKTQGLSPQQHPVTEELERVRDYFHKLNTVAGKTKPDQMTLRLNKDAADRFIKHALADVNEDQNSTEDDRTMKKRKSPADSSEESKRSKH